MDLEDEGFGGGVWDGMRDGRGGRRVGCGGNISPRLERLQSVDVFESNKVGGASIYFRKVTKLPSLVTDHTCNRGEGVEIMVAARHP